MKSIMTSTYRELKSSTIYRRTSKSTALWTRFRGKIWLRDGNLPLMLTLKGAWPKFISISSLKSSGGTFLTNQKKTWNIGHSCGRNHHFDENPHWPSDFVLWKKTINHNEDCWKSLPEIWWTNLVFCPKRIHTTVEIDRVFAHGWSFN